MTNLIRKHGLSAIHLPITINDFEQIDQLVDIIASQANNYPFTLGGSKAYFHNWLFESKIPPEWANLYSAGLSGAARADARDIVRWAISKGFNPAEPGYTTLGSMLKSLKDDLGIEESRYVFAALLGEVDQQTQYSLISEYDLPLKALPLAAEAAIGYGPDFEWLGPSESVQLQSFLKPPPVLIDIGVLQVVLERSTGVCRIEFTQSDVRATGFLISPDLLLTNYHVFGKTDEELKANSPKAIFKFGKVTVLGSEKDEAKGKTFYPDEQTPIVIFNQTLDYALVHVQRSIQTINSISPIPIANDVPITGDELHLLGHPAGEAMKLAMSSEGIVYVSATKGIAQYTTPSQAGASGSPCFSDDWKAIVLHQSERSRGFGVVRQGILMTSILAEIHSFL